MNLLRLTELVKPGTVVPTIFLSYFSKTIKKLIKKLKYYFSIKKNKISLVIILFAFDCEKLVATETDGRTDRGER